MSASLEVRCSKQRANRATVATCLLMLVSLLHGCGGGDSDSPDPPPPPPPPPAPSGLSYPAPQSYAFTVGVTITPLQPVVTGTVATWSIAPGLPPGLSMSGSGVISGTPTVATPMAGYTARATNAGGSATATLSITVNAPPVAAPSGLSYAGPQAFVIGNAIAPLQPTVTGSVTAYSVNPALPAGLTFSTATGIIAGTPTAIAASASYLITASNAGGSTSTTLSLAVIPPPVAAPSGLSYTGPHSFVVGAAIVPLQPTVTGSVVSYAVSPALPAGLTFNTSSGIITGTPTAVAASATYRITASNAGGSTFHDLVIAVVAPTVQPGFRVGGVVSGHAGGTLVLRLNGAEELARTANGAFLFSALLNTGANYIVEVSANPSAPVQTCQVGNATGVIAGSNVVNVTVTCTLVRYEVGAQVSGLNGSGLKLRDLEWDIEVPLGGNGYTAIHLAAVGAIYDFALDVEPANPGQFCIVHNGLGYISDRPVTITVECRDKPAPGRFVYVPNYGSATISGFSINQQTGQLTPVPGSPFATAALPAEVFSLPDGRFLYVRSDSTESIAGYAIDDLTGALTQIPGSPFASANPFNSQSWEFATAVHPSGRFMYRYGRVGLFIGVIGHAIDQQTGALTLIPGSPFPAGYPALFLNDPAGEMRVHPNGQYLYFSHEDGNGTGITRIAAFSIDPVSGSLVRTGTPWDVPSIPDDIVVDPAGGFMYTLFYQARRVLAASLDLSDGSVDAITQGITLSAGGSPWSGVIDPAGRFLMLAADDGQFAVTEIFNIDPDQGELHSSMHIEATAVPALGSGRPQLHGNGRFLYQSLAISNQIAVAEVREFSDQGSLSVPAVSPVNTLTGPTPLAMDASGRWLFVAGWDTGSLAAYAIDPATGALALVPGSPVAVGTNPYLVVVVP